MSALEECTKCRRVLCLAPCTPEIAEALEQAHAAAEERERSARYRAPVPAKESPRPDYRYGKAPRLRRAVPVADELR